MNWELFVVFLCYKSMGKILKDKNRLTYIYVLKHPLTNEIRYVGKTVKLLHKRLHNHIYEATKRYKPNYRCNWIKSLVNQGLKPLIEEIDNCTWENSAKLEIHYIQYYKSIGCRLINLTDGGEGILGLKYTEQRINNLKNALRKNSKKVYQYDLDGNFIKEWVNAKEASEKTGALYANIIHCCKGLKKRHGNFMWSYIKYKKVSPYTVKKRIINVTKNNTFILKRKKVLITNLETGEILIANSILEASRITNTCTASICKECKNKCKTKGKYKFKYYGS
jgi:hypothetical protein